MDFETFIMLVIIVAIVLIVLAYIFRKRMFDVLEDSWIFDECGEMRDQLESAILAELQKKQYPLKVNIQTVKSGGIFLGSRDQCIVVDLGKESQIVVLITSVGFYLYVKLRAQVLIQPAQFLNVFYKLQAEAVYEAAKASIESAFKQLHLKQADSGYKAVRRESTCQLGG